MQIAKWKKVKALNSEFERINFETLNPANRLAEEIEILHAVAEVAKVS